MYMPLVNIPFLPSAQFYLQHPVLYKHGNIKILCYLNRNIVSCEFCVEKKDCIATKNITK